MINALHTFGVDFSFSAVYSGLSVCSLSSVSILSCPFFRMACKWRPFAYSGLQAGAGSMVSLLLVVVLSLNLQPSPAVQFFPHLQLSADSESAIVTAAQDSRLWLKFLATISKRCHVIGQLTSGCWGSSHGNARLSRPTSRGSSAVRLFRRQE